MTHAPEPLESCFNSTFHPKHSRRFRSSKCSTIRLAAVGKHLCQIRSGTLEDFMLKAMSKTGSKSSPTPTKGCPKDHRSGKLSCSWYLILKHVTVRKCGKASKFKTSSWSRRRSTSKHASRIRRMEKWTHMLRYMFAVEITKCSTATKS